MVADTLLLDLSIVIVIATVFAYFAKVLKQPLIPAYILTGIIIGPILGLINDKTSIAFLSEFGIALMLFIVGLEMNIDRLKAVFKISTFGGTIRTLIFFTFGFLISMYLGFIRIEALYIGVFIAFSSTMVVVKLLTDKKQLDTLHGRIIVGMLLMEDFLAIIALSVLSTETFSILAVTISLIKVVVIFLIAFLGYKYVFPRVFKFAASHTELLLLLSISVLLFFTSLSKYMGELIIILFPNLPLDVIPMIRPELSIIIGAFIAGVMLGNLPYYVEIISRVNPLKDFFATMFFVSLGIELVWVPSIVWPLIILTLVVLFFKPFITIMVCTYFGYKKRTSFQTAISLTQISEFSLIVAAQGFLLHHISQEVFSLAVIIGVFSMAISTYFINFEKQIYETFSKRLSWFDRFEAKTPNLEYKTKTKNMVILCGHNRIGFSVLRTLKKMKKRILVIDFNPEIIKALIKKRVPCLYGDIGEIETLERLNLKEAEMIVCTVGEFEDNLLIINKAKEVESKAKLFMTANEIDDALKLYDAGADYVILPHFLGGEHASSLIRDLDNNQRKIVNTRKEHIKELLLRTKLGHHHPGNGSKRVT